MSTLYYLHWGNILQTINVLGDAVPAGAVAVTPVGGAVSTSRSRSTTAVRGSGKANVAGSGGGTGVKGSA